jgi:hypothetical protein
LAGLPKDYLTVNAPVRNFPGRFADGQVALLNPSKRLRGLPLFKRERSIFRILCAIAVAEPPLSLEHVGHFLANASK